MPHELIAPKPPRWYDSIGRAVCDVEIDGYDCDAYIARAVYDDTPPGVIEEVPDVELDWMQDHFAAEISERAFENAVGAAESYWEGDR